jgi:hypothetical protein
MKRIRYNRIRIYISIVGIGMCLILEPANDGWKLVWEDNFDWNGAVDPNKWEFYVGGHGWGKYFNLFFNVIFFVYIMHIYIYILQL